MNPSLLYFTKFSVVKKFMHGSGVEYQDVPSKTFCPTVPRNFVGKSFSVSPPSGAEEVWIREGGGSIKIFRRKKFCLTVPKSLVREPLRVSLISGIEKIFAPEGYVTIFDLLSKFFCLTVPKNFVGEPFCAVFHKIFGSEKVYA